MAELNELIGGRYLVQEPLGEGGSGSIYQAWDQQLGRMVAVKRIKENPSIEASIRHEAGILAALDHPNVVTVFDFGSDESGHFVVMELLKGRTLEAIVQEQPLTVPKFIFLMNQICRGLAAAHGAGLVHCDLKPANIMLQTHRDGSFTAKVLDFGLATAENTELPQSDSGESRTIQGSPLTIAPEQLMGYTADVRSDIYSLGCTFYFSLSGVYPHDADDVQAIVQSHLYNTPRPLHRLKPEIPEPLSIAIMKMISRDPDARQQDAESVRITLEGAARAPSAHRRAVGGGAIPDYSRNPTGTLTSTILPAPQSAPTPSATQPLYQPVQYSDSVAQAPAATPGSNLRIQLLISGCSLLLIIVGALAFWFSSKKDTPKEAPAPIDSTTKSIMDLIDSTGTPTPTPRPTPSAVAVSTPSPTPKSQPKQVPTPYPTPKPSSQVATGNGGLINAADSKLLAANKGKKVSVECTVGSFMDSSLFHARLLRLMNSNLILSIPEQKMTSADAKSFVGKKLKVSGVLSNMNGTDLLLIDGPGDLQIAP